MFDPEKHHRRSIRLKGYDYSQSALYYVTVCTQNREMRFGEVVDAEMILNPAGQMVWRVWESLPERFPGLERDCFIVMPNHLHGVFGYHSVLQTEIPAKRAALGEIVGAFKSILTVEYIRGVKAGLWPPFQGHLFQRNYFEHIVRDDESLDKIRDYVRDNPARWHLDRENPDATGMN